jgi:Carboxypeptidase regulatory-like domain/TonB-dependent Receptor Plug Domain
MGRMADSMMSGGCRLEHERIRASANCRALFRRVGLDPAKMKGYCMSFTPGTPKRTLAYLLVAFGLCMNLFGQERFGEITGTIKDPSSAAIPNATVSLTNLDTLKVTTVKSGGDGNYVARNVEPGHYKGRIEANGFSATEFPDLVVLLGKSLTIDATLRLGTTSETVQVTDVAPLIDTTTTQVSHNVTAEEFNRMPKARTFQNMVTLAPTATAGDLEGGIQVNGASAGENNFIIDGITTSSALQGQSRTNAAFEILDEVQIKTSGIEAQYGGATGGVISAITKSGGNTFHGDVHYYLLDNALAAGPVKRLLMNPTDLLTTGYVQDNKQHNRTNEIGYALGGYFIKNRLYFFSAASPRFEDRIQKYLTSDNQTTTLHRDQRFWQAYNKVSADITSKLRFNAGFYWSPFSAQGALLAYSKNGNESTSSKASVDANQIRGFFNPQVNYNADVTYTVNPTTLVNVRFGRNYDNYKALGIPDVRAIEWGVPGTGVPGLAPEFQLAKGATTIPRQQNTFFDIATRTNLQVDVSKIVRLGGTHDFKAGFGRQKMVNNVNLAYGGGGYVTLYWNTPYADPVTKKDYTGKYGYYTLDDIGTKGTTGGTIDNIYFQDRWKATSRLSLDLGLRLERERVPSFRPDIQKYAFEFGFGQKVAPRLGASYDIFGDGKWKAYGSYGLFYDWIKYELSRGTFGGDHWNQYVRGLDTLDVLSLRTGLQGANFVAGGAAPYIDLRLPAFGNSQVDPNIKPLSTSLLNIGLEHQFSSKLVMTARYTRNHLRNAIEDVGTLDAQGSEAYLYGNPGQGLVKNSNPSGSIVKAFEWPRPKREYNAFDLTVTRRFANHFFVGGSYTYSRLYGNYSGIVSTDEVRPPGTGSGFGPAQQTGTQSTRAGTSSSRYYDYDFMQYDARGNIGNYGLLPSDHPHQFKLYGSYEKPWSQRFGKTELGWNYFIQSGTPQTTQVSSSFAGNPPSYVNGRGDLGRSPVISQTDLVLSHTFNITEKKSLRFEFNAQNLFNQKTAQLLYTFYNRYRTTSSGVNMQTFDWSKPWDYKAQIAKTSDALTKAYGALDPRFGKEDLFRTGFVGRFGVKFIF